MVFLSNNTKPGWRRGAEFYQPEFTLSPSPSALILNLLLDLLALWYRHACNQSICFPHDSLTVCSEKIGSLKHLL